MTQIQDQTQTQKQVIQHMMFQCIEMVRDVQKAMTDHINNYKYHDDSYIEDNVMAMEDGEHHMIGVLKQLKNIEKMIQ